VTDLSEVEHAADEAVRPPVQRHFRLTFATGREVDIWAESEKRAIVLAGQGQPASIVEVDDGP
jgi:hypothetical protein